VGIPGRVQPAGGPYVFHDFVRDGTSPSPARRQYIFHVIGIGFQLGPLFPRRTEHGTEHVFR